MPKQNVNFRLDKDEYAEIQQEAEDRGLSVSEYLRRIVKNRDAAVDITKDELINRLEHLETKVEDLDE